MSEQHVRLLWQIRAALSDVEDIDAVDAAIADVTRMDWADKNLADFSRGHSTVHYVLSNQGDTSVGHTVREAINQAMIAAAPKLAGEE